MNTINPALLRGAYKLTADFYEAGIECPPLVDFNRWLLSQQITPATGETPIGSMRAPAGTFDEALAAALKSSPRGVDIADLRSILAGFGKTGPEIGAALGRMKRAGTAEKRGDLWSALPRQKGADRSLVAGRGTRRKPAAAAGARNAEPDAGGTHVEDEPQRAAG